jgi:FeS assembly SUF system protein
MTSPSLEDRVVEALKKVYDPEIPVSIYELGLVYEVTIDAAGKVDIKMTLTSPNCPEAQALPPEVEQRVKDVSGVSEASVEIVWEPAWSPERMSEAARLELGML